MQKKTKIIIISTILLLITIPIIILLTKNTNKQIPQPLTEQAKAQYETIIGDQTYEITNAVLEAENITPTVSAGMIPIKWNGENFEITTRANTDWYNYANGKPAYIMLNDGYYKSEIEQGIANEQLMENAVGNDALVVPNVPDNNPTIYMWIPRFAYNAQGEILYIKQACSVAGTYTIPEIFTYQTEKRDFSLAGIWIEYTPLANTSEVNTKISNMQGPNNKYGFIANTIGTNANNESSYKSTIETYNQHIANIVNGTTGASSTTDSTTDTNTVGAPLAGIPEGHGTAVPITIADISNLNRTILKITNSDQLEPIKGKAYYDKIEEKIKIEVTYRTNAITKILNSRGTILSENSTTADSGDEIIGNKTYKFIVIDNLGNQKQIQTSVTGLDIYIIENEDDLKLFRDAVNSNKTTTKTKAYQIADVKMNEGKYTIDAETGDITFAEDAEKWTGITTTYYGKYYGNNHTISGIYGNKGLFDSCSGAEIKDLGIKESYIESSSSQIGSIVGYAQDNTTLENCYNEATIKVLHVLGVAGGLVGETAINSGNTQLILNKCYNKGNIIVDDYNQIFVGGLIGRCSKGSITNCYNLGKIVLQNKRNASSYVGGLIGYSNEGLIINNCYNTGNVIGCNTGGITGSNNASINNCYNIGIIEGVNDVGGIVGSNSYYRAKIIDSYNKGEIIGTSNIGSISGYNGGIIQNCYYEEYSDLLGVGNGKNTGTTKLTQDEMPTILSIINGDNAFVEDTNNINNGYPILAWQEE